MVRGAEKKRRVLNCSKAALSAILMFAAVLLAAGNSNACVGRTLHIGTVDTPEGMVLTNLFVVLIGERTGTTAIPAFYESSEALYAAAAKGEVDIIIEDTETALSVLEDKKIRTVDSKDLDAGQKYRILKDAYEKELNLIWLDASGNMKNDGSESYVAPVITKAALQFFPALPRVVNKLSKVLDYSVIEKLSAEVDSGDKPKRAARDFLRERRLI